MKTKEFYDLRHAAGYVVGTYIMFDGKLHYVSDIAADQPREGGGVDFIAHALEEVNPKNVKINTKDPRLDMTPVQLGFVQEFIFNRYGPCQRVMRAPRRQWKVGTNCKALHINDFYGGNRHRAKPELFQSVGFHRCLRNQYPSFAEALKAATEQRVPVAFSRRFAVNEKRELYHLISVRPIGKVGADGRIELNKRFAYFQEALDEEINREH